MARGGSVAQVLVVVVLAGAHEALGLPALLLRSYM